MGIDLLVVDFYLLYGIEWSLKPLFINIFNLSNRVVVFWFGWTSLYLQIRQFHHHAALMSSLFSLLWRGIWRWWCLLNCIIPFFVSILKFLASRWLFLLLIRVVSFRLCNFVLCACMFPGPLSLLSCNLYYITSSWNTTFLYINIPPFSISNNLYLFTLNVYLRNTHLLTFRSNLCLLLINLEAKARYSNTLKWVYVSLVLNNNSEGVLCFFRFRRYIAVNIISQFESTLKLQWHWQFLKFVYASFQSYHYVGESQRTFYGA